MNTLAPYRLMILTSATGGGHDARADATIAWAREIYGAQVEVCLCRPLEDKRSRWGSVGVWFYNTIQRYLPWLHQIYFELIEVIGDRQQGKRYIGQHAYESALMAFRPQMIISLHDFLNKGYFEAAKRLLPGVRCMTYSGEYTAGNGFSRHWVSAYADLWVGRTPEATAHALQLGISAEKLSTFAFYLPPEEVSPNELTAAQMRQRLGLEEGRLTILLASGRNGAMQHIRTLQALSPLADKIQVIAVCGLNERLRREVLAWQEKHPIPMIVEGYSTRMRDHMQAADIVFCRGGANTATRAFFEGAPIWFDASEGIMPQERLTVDFFVRSGAAEVIDSPALLAERLELALAEKGYLEALRLRMARLREAHLSPAPRQFFRRILAWGLERHALAPISAPLRWRS
jgi:processive 1,2-diacylglycerol beta-glucosyltransferase